MSLDKLIADAKKRKEERVRQNLETNKEYQKLVLAKEDTKKLDTIIEQLEKAYGKNINRGYTYSDNVEKLLSIVNAIQYAKKEIRELIPEEMFLLFPQGIRDTIIESAGRLPWNMPKTLVPQPDGSMKEIASERVAQAKTGIKADIPMLNASLLMLSDELDLLVPLEVTQEQHDKAWKQAKDDLQLEEELQKATDALDN